MKRVRLKSLTLTNWRGERSRTTEFQPTETTIAGANGTGKTRHFDAFMWLLFGKDSQDRKDYNIKSIVEGQPLAKTECEVVGTLDVDGEAITLRRAFVEEWVKPRGQTEQVFKGNKTECYWNEAPVSVTEYQRRVAAIVDDNVFKMVTNPAYFVSMPWRAQRDQLFALAGAVADEEIAEGNPDFTALLERLSGKGLEDYKRELAARKKRLKVDLAEIQPRIDQTQRLMPQVADVALLQRELASIEAEIDAMDRAIADIAERKRQQGEQRQRRMDEINAMKQEQKRVLHTAETEAQERAYRASAKSRELQERIRTTERAIHGWVQDKLSAESQIAKLQQRAEELTQQSDELRQAWYRESEATYTGETKCSCCGQELPETMIAEALELFNKGKQSRLEAITAEGRGYKAELEEVETRIAEAQQDRQTAIDEAKELEESLHTMHEQLSSLAEVKPHKVVPEDIAEWCELEQRIAEAETLLAQGGEQIYTDSAESYQEVRRELIGRRDEVRDRLSDGERAGQLQSQIAELEEQGRALAQQIAEAEGEEHTMAQFTRARVDECERRINGLFSRVTFQLFDYTIEDTRRENPIETCIPLVGGVPVSVANTASQVNAGLDIINALSRFYGVSAPIFIDNRESVTELIPTDSQRINLKVTDDPHLLIQ